MANRPLAPRPRHALVTLITLGASLAAACSKGEAASPAAAAAADSAAMVLGFSPANGTTVGILSPEQAAARVHAEANRYFLRAMVDRHEGMLAIVDAAMPRLTDTPKKDARPLRDAQAAELGELVAMLRAAGDSAPPAVSAEDRAAADALRQATVGGTAARAFYRQAAAHHQAGLALVDSLLPQLAGDVRARAERLRASQARELAELKRKGGV